MGTRVKFEFLSLAAVLRCLRYKGRYLIHHITCLLFSSLSYVAIARRSANWIKPRAGFVGLLLLSKHLLFL